MATNRNGDATLSSRSNDITSNDPKYKKYALAVEKCLTTFDNVNEWADFISFLTKLLKTFQSYMQFKEIPRKLIVAKRLAQCLNPALPTGVHQRALDVYAHVLAVLGPGGLKRDLPLWSSGLFPFFEYAATSVKPTLLNLYSIHYLPLNEGLRPVMKAFIVALLPGLEEETGEFFDKVLSLLDKLSEAVSPAFFFQTMWLILLTTPSARGPALNYLSRRLPALIGDDDPSIIGRDIGLMIRALASALEDEHLLVKRGVLDLLHQSLRMESPAFKKAHPEDQKILVKAAMSVVLRRDLTLNRRLYAWLVGSKDESSETQIAYLRAHSLELLSSTLRGEMLAPIAESGGARPYKIFISFLDKWEIGSPLTEILILDALKAVHRARLEQGQIDDALEAEMIVAANNIYERVDLQIVWRQLTLSLRSNLSATTGSSEALDTVRLVLTSFRNHDEEAQRIHIPLFLMSTVDAIQRSIKSDQTHVELPKIHETLGLLNKALSLIPTDALIQWEPLEGEDRALSDLYAQAAQLYSLPTAPDGASTSTDGAVAKISPFSFTFSALIDLSTSCATRISRGHCDLERTRECLLGVMSLLIALVRRVESQSRKGVSTRWNPSLWLSSMLACFVSTTPFEVVDEMVRLFLTLSESPFVQPRLDIDNRIVISRIFDHLLRFLGPDYTAYHVRAVHWIWAIEGEANHHHVESIIARSLTAPEAKYSYEAIEAFGVLWRLTDDSMLPGSRLRIPMLVVLESLRSDNPGLRRIGETWMRSSLKSYIRVLDPILYDLVTSGIVRTPHTSTYHGRSVGGFLYQRPFDQHQVHYVLESLLAIIRFGSQGFVKTVRGTQLKRSLHPELFAAAEAANVAHAASSYMDVLIDVLLSFLQSEPHPTLHMVMTVYNLRIQATVIELLQAIVARGEVDAATLETIEAAIISRLFAAVHTHHLDLQNKLLHVLHSVIFASTSMTQPGQKVLRGSEKEKSTDPGPSPYHGNPLLVQTLIDGLSAPTNRPVLQHWVDFVLMSVAQFQSLSHAIPPLCECLCKQLHKCLSDIQSVVAHNGKGKTSMASFATDVEIISLLNALERLVLLSISKTDESSPSEDEAGPSERGASDAPSGILGYVFGVDGSSSSLHEEPFTSRSSGYRALYEAVRVLHTMWTVTSELSDASSSAIKDSISLVTSRVRTRCLRILEHLFKAQAHEVIESLVMCSFTLPLMTSGSSTIDIIDALASNAQTVVQILCEAIIARVVPSLDRGKKAVLNPNLSDANIFAFLESYLGQLEGPIAVQIWARFTVLAKELASSPQAHRQQIYPLFRCMTVLSEIIAQTSALEDRKMRKELQETYTKLADSCILIAGRSFDQGNWIRRSTKDAVASSGRASPTPDSIDANTDEKQAISISHADTSRGSGMDIIDQVNEYIATKCLPNLRRFIVDNDKVTTLCSNMVYYIINPAMKARSIRSLDVDDVILDMLAEMTKIPASTKAWRPVIAEAFNDSRFFNCSPPMSLKWRPLVRALMDVDRTNFTELLGRMTATPSANIFTNRETEMLLRSLNLRRLSYVLFTGEKNHFLAQLPVIQEKLVDILRTNVVAPVVHSEVYLCMRVLLCRLSPRNLSSFWPVILTELVRIFEQTLAAPPQDGSDDLLLILSACKFLDLLVVLQTEEFQVHQWMFITDTVDALHRPPDWSPDSLMDQLAQIIGDIPDTRNIQKAEKNGPGVNNASGNATDSKARADAGPSSSGVSVAEPVSRRPLLGSVKSIDSILDLQPFFSRVSLFAYESTYAGGLVDWDAVELGLLNDIFDGR